MAFELIFGESTKPGSWEVCEPLLTLNTTDDLEVFRKKIITQAKKRFPPRGTKSELRKLKSTRDGAYSIFDKHEVALEKCLELAEFENTFTEDNLIVAIRALTDMKRTEEALIYSYIFEHYYHYQSNEVSGFEDLFATCYDTEMGEDEVGSKLTDVIDKWVGVGAILPVRIRLAYLCDVVFFMILGKHVTWTGPHCEDLANGIEKNDFLLDKFQSPINFKALNVFERFEISLMLDMVRLMSGSRNSNRKWRATFIENLATVFESTETLAFLLATGGGWPLCRQFEYFSMPLFLPGRPWFQPPSVYAYGDSITWICNASVAVILFGYPVSNPELLERPKVSIPFPLVLRQPSIDWPNDDCKSLLKLLEVRNRSIDWPNDCDVLLKLLDLLSFLAVASRADWFIKMVKLATRRKIDPRNESSTRKMYTDFGTTQVCHDLQIEVLKKLRSMTDVCEHLQSFFAHVVSLMKFTSGNMDLFKPKYLLSNMWLVVCPLIELIAPADPIAGTPRQLASLLSNKTLREMWFKSFVDLFCHTTTIKPWPKLVDVMCFFCSAQPSLLLRDYDDRTSRWQASLFGEKTIRTPEGPRILALVLRSADDSLRKLWAGVDLFREQLLVFAVDYFCNFIFDYKTSIRVRMNQLLALHAIIRPQPIVSLADVLSAIDSDKCKPRTKKEKAMEMLFSSLMPSNPDGFQNGSLSLLPTFGDAFRSFGKLVAGIAFQTFMSEWIKINGAPAARKLANTWPKDRKVLVANMKLQLANFG